MKNFFRVVVALLGSLLLGIGVVSAHVVVKPNQVGIAAFQTFTMGVPNEKDDLATTAMRLVIPSGLKNVSPTVKNGWTITTKKDGDTVTEISWTGGSIPGGQRDDFTFSAQVPASPTELQWKAYQTYSDGTVVSWDQAPNGSDDEEVTPYSTTKVVDDLSSPASSTASDDMLAKELSWTAVVVSILALIFSFRRR